MATNLPDQHGHALPAPPSPTHTPPATKTSLLDLPPEIRNRIYEFTLLHDVYVFALAYLFVVEPGLVRCSKQIREETYSIFWSGNTFYFPDTTMAQMSLDLLHRDKVAALRSVRVCVWDFVTDAPDCLPYIRRSLRELFATGEKKGLRSDAIKMPLKVKGENEICWATMRDAEGFEVDRRYMIERKAASMQR